MCTDTDRCLAQTDTLCVELSCDWPRLLVGATALSAQRRATTVRPCGYDDQAACACVLTGCLELRHPPTAVHHHSPHRQQIRSVWSGADRSLQGESNPRRGTGACSHFACPLCTGTCDRSPPVRLDHAHIKSRDAGHRRSRQRRSQRLSASWICVCRGRLSPYCFLLSPPPHTRADRAQKPISGSSDAASGRSLPPPCTPHTQST